MEFKIFVGSTYSLQVHQSTEVKETLVSWLTPSESSFSYDPDTLVAAAVAQHGEILSEVLSAFDEVDAFHCFYGMNTDEYLRYAERFVEGFNREKVVMEKITEEFVTEVVRRSFHISQVVQGFVTDEDIRQIAKLIWDTPSVQTQLS